jgi:predicted outer membrane repeat protein
MLTVTNSTIYANTAQYGGGVYNDTNGILTIMNTTFYTNTAIIGSGSYNFGTLMVTNNTFSGNSASGGHRSNPSSGSIYNSGTLMVSNSIFSSNISLAGGGIDNEWGVATVTNSTFSGNTAGLGGGVFNYDFGELTVTSSAFLGNNATNSGGGIYTPNGVKFNFSFLHNSGILGFTVSNCCEVQDDQNRIYPRRN